MSTMSDSEQRRQFEELRKQTTPDEIRAIEQQWSELIAEVRDAQRRHLDPASVEAQALVDRNDALVAATFRGNTELMATVGEKYEQGTFADRPELPTPADFDYLRRAREARGN